MTQGNKGTEALRAEVSVERPERPRGQRMEARPRPPPAPPSRLRVPDLELPGHPPRSSEGPSEPEARLPSRGHSLGCGSHYCFSDQQFSGPHPAPASGMSGREANAATTLPAVGAPVWGTPCCRRRPPGAGSAFGSVFPISAGLTSGTGALGLGLSAVFLPGVSSLHPLLG